MAEFKKNDLFEATIEAWSSDGAGVCRIDGRAVFVAGAIPGEKHTVRIVKAGKSAVFGKSEELLTPSPHRVESDCPHFPKCGGCTMRHISYEEELRFKLSRVNEAYVRIGKIDLRAKEIFGAEQTERYRNKAVYAVGNGFYGFFRPRSHDIIPVSRCLIQTEAADLAAKTVCAFMAENGVPAYDEKSGSGLIRHVFTRTGFSSNQLQVTVVSAGGLGAKTKLLTESLRSALPEVTSIVLNINKSRGNTVLAGDFYTLYGSDTITDTLCGLDFELSPLSFYQVNPTQAEKLYGIALNYAAPEGTDLVLDLYCGAGTISLCLAKGARRVIGAEIVPQAIENARGNAARNGISNAEFICADAALAVKTLSKEGKTPDAVVIDPPRKGLSPEVIASICEMRPQRVVYVSCDPATQARDLRIFEDSGYRAAEAVAVDMFPRTSHVETVVLLLRT